MQTSDFEIPPIPAGAQQIYCEQHVANTSFERVVSSFKANSNYDVLWIFPKETTPPSPTNSGPTAWLEVAKPELVNINSFTAGPTPNPTPGNCTVTIGPAAPPTCTISDVTYTWHGPGGQSINVAVPNLQIQVDAADPANVGTWILTMNGVGAVVTNSSCSKSISVSVDVPSSCTNFWPKAYGNTDGGGILMKGNQGNILVSAAGILTNSTFYNHFGVFPPSSQTTTQTIQYTASGVTNWIDANYSPKFCFQSGIVLMKSGQYIDGTTGYPVTPPINLSVNEEIIAETLNGSIITKTNNFLKVYVGSVPSPAIDMGTDLWGTKYNRATDDLIIQGMSYFTNSSFFKILHFNGGSFQQTYTNTYSGILPYYIQSVDNNNKCYFLNVVGSTSKLMNWNYINNTTSPVNISGFVNDDLSYFPTTDIYTDNIAIIYNDFNKFMYALDFSNSTSKKISTVNISGITDYVRDGNDLYISTMTNMGAVQIGSQTIPYVNPNTDGFCIAKVQMTDFNFKQSDPKNEEQIITQNNVLKAIVSPNPITNNSLVLKITEVAKINASFTYDILITNRMGETVLKNRSFIAGSKIDISALPNGPYFIVVTNPKNERTTVSFIKQ